MPSNKIIRNFEVNKIEYEAHGMEDTSKNYITQYADVKKGNKYINFLYKILRNPLLLILKFFKLYKVSLLLPDRFYISFMYRVKTGLWPNLNNPRRFTEKLQWMKLHKNTANYSTYADKYEVRSFIANQIGDHYLIPLINVFDSADAIDFSRLPNQFVLKCTHDSGTTIICRDSSTINSKSIRKALNKALRRNYYYLGRELQYKNIKPRIVCEEFISEQDDNVPLDYKFFCFDGAPKYIQIDLNRFENHERIIYTLDWEKAPFSIKLENSNQEVEKPSKFDEMVTVASTLSRGFKFVRVDLYLVNDKVYFGELTFFQGAGYELFIPDEYDEKIGDLINLEI